MNLLSLFGFSAPSNDKSPKSPQQTIQLCEKLIAERGELSGTRLAADTLAAYRMLSPEARAEFFDLLVERFAPDGDEIGAAGVAYQQDPSPANLERLRRALQAPRQDLFHLLNMAPGGTATLVAMRGELLKGVSAHPHWEGVANDLAELFGSWFNRGFLELRRIDWNSPAAMLEKLIRYEAVHEIQGWPDLQRRLEADRRCYAFVHPALPGEPVVFIEVGLTDKIEAQIQPLVDPKAPVGKAETATSAIFYSITNCHEGLRGIPFGSFLIKQVVDELRHELPNLRRFATLSPLPGFRRWMSQQPALKQLYAATEDPAWASTEDRHEKLREQLEAAAAYYLLHAKTDTATTKDRPLDPVARFHLRNGARLNRINWLGDRSTKGMRQSAGIMVNYLYRLRELERNHEQFTKHNKIAAASNVEALAKKCPLAQPVNAEDQAKSTSLAGPKAIAS